MSGPSSGQPQPSPRDCYVITAWWDRWQRWVTATAFEPATRDLIAIAFANEYGRAHQVDYLNGCIEYRAAIPDWPHERRATDRATIQRVTADACWRAAATVNDIDEAERWAGVFRSVEGAPARIVIGAGAPQEVSA